ncbi:MAG: dodecin domain-containing protein [Candidatus Altiarchaeota archaeon]|nr:dodecin domain-containing protein [Candidatus Altiarchaeota archaeon]
MLRMLEVVGTSDKGFSEAVNNAVEELSGKGEIMHFFEVVEQRGAVRDGRIREYQVKVKIAVE